MVERGAGRGASPTVDELDAAARTLLEGGRVTSLLPDPEPWRGRATAGHPWAAILVAAALDVHDPDDPEVERLLERATEELGAAGDRLGVATVHFVRGLIVARRGHYDQAVERWNRCLDEAGDEVRTPQLLALLSLESYLAGDFSGALARVEEAFGRAVEAGSDAEAARAALYLALYTFTKGDLRRAERLMDEASSRFERAGAGERPDGEPVLVALRAQLVALRGDLAAARRLFDRAERLADEQQAWWYQRLLLARRAEAMALQPDLVEVAELRARLDAVPAVPDATTEVIVERAKGMAAAAAGDPDEAEAHLRQAIAMRASRLERARSHLVLGELLLAFGDLAEAAEALHEARQQLLESDSAYWQARALWLLARADPAHAARWEAIARTFDDGDVAYRVLFAPPGGMRVSLVDGPAVEIGGRPVAFATRNAELATLALALAGDEGLDAVGLARCLWPDAGADRLRPRLRTMLWHVRTALGSESWRVVRRGDRLVLDLAGAVVEVDDDGRSPGRTGELGRILDALQPDR